MYKSSFLEQLFNILFPDSGKHRTAIRRIVGRGTGKKAVFPTVISAKIMAADSK